METSRREFLTATAIAPAVRPSPAPLDAFPIARRHTLVRDLPTPNFFEGLLLGNGDIGACVTVRPDALGLHLGKVDSWDTRVDESHYPHVLHFREFLDLWRRASEEARSSGRPDLIHLEREVSFFREYTEKVTASYRKPYPRPWPCGTIWIHWDPRWVRLVRQSLDPSNGLLSIDLLDHGRPMHVLAFVNWTANHVHVSTEGPAPFLSLAYYPYIDRESGLPPPELRAEPSAFGCREHCFTLEGRLAGAWQPEPASPRRVLLRSPSNQPFRLDLTLTTPRDRPEDLSRLASTAVDRLRRDSEQGWRDFWSRSAVSFDDPELERIWHHNQYFLACTLRAGKVAPGLFGNWMSGRIGTAWHGDYHLNYNTQQVFWGVFSSNHVDQHLPYVELVENLLAMSERFAREKFSLPGAFFPHSAYPVPSQVIPYPAPPWGYEVCETPWTVQSLWWHYQYTLDEAFLRRAWPPLLAAARFLAAYVRKEGDGRYHVFPTVSPENWGCTADFRLNRDCIVDLALIEFLLDAVVEASKILRADPAERARWAEIRANLAPYPKSAGPHGEVWLDVPGAPLDHVYNIPATLAPVFPGEQVGLGRREDLLEIARRTARTVRLEGGNDLVYLPLILVRLSLLDLDFFRREVRYCLLPNGVANDRVRQTGGRYSDSTDFDFMMRMGVWTENLSLPAVLNECMLQSYTGVLRLFANTRNLGPARFRSLRAAGAFLVSASWDGRTVSEVEIVSEKGAPLRLVNPWKPGLLEYPTQAGVTYRLEPPDGRLVVARRLG
jgi:hypothetical protein